MSATDTLLNTLFDGRYRILRKLGAGGMANVYLAEDQSLGRRVAIKILNDRHANDDQFVERFRREATSAAGLSHPNIVSIYDRGEAEGTYYIAMEHLDGRNLKELIIARGPAPAHVAVDYAKQILAALRFAHRHGIVHRDIKRHNVLVDADGRVKVTDFGIARAGGTQMTEVGSIVGTAQYLSPEQARGAPVDQRSDLYSLGIVLYELLTGTVPFTGDAPVEIAMKHLSDVPEPPSRRRPGIARELDLIVMRALAKDPDDRFQTAEEMERELDRFERGERVTAETAEAATSVIAGASAMPTTISRAPTTVRTAATRPYATAPPVPDAVIYDYDERPRRRRAVWPWVVVALLLVGALVGAFYAYDQIRDQLNETKPVSVPFVEGTQKELAKTRLREKGLRWEITYQFSDDVRVGHVIDQDPEAGNRIERGNLVQLVVSYGRERVKVPDVRGKSVTDAVFALTQAGLRANAQQVPSDKPTGTVVAQDPGPDERVRKNTRVRINVSKGPQLVAVPDVVGEAFASANSILQGAGFAVSKRDVESTEEAGIVVGQSPAGNSSVAEGSTVTVQVSKGPKPVAVPSVTGMSAEQATAALQRAGFETSVQTSTTDQPNLDGTVIAQNPAARAKALPGNTVTITVAQFEGGDDGDDGGDGGGQGGQPTDPDAVVP